MNHYPTIKQVSQKGKPRMGFTLVELIAVIAVLGILAAIGIPRYLDVQDRSRVKADGTTAMEMIRLARLAETDTKSDSMDTVESYVKRNFTQGDYPAPQSGGEFALSKTNDYWTVKWTPTNSGHYNVEQTIHEGNMEQWLPQEDGT